VPLLVSTCVDEPQNPFASFPPVHVEPALVLVALLICAEARPEPASTIAAAAPATRKTFIVIAIPPGERS
jgi:hypothetical protein